ncbi:hypothetical protein GF362_04675 [Candidatus Dojkabacteria bacterium]|nr:hypothetical protein [Candidatus Dojkabacteria bacterium]
MEDKDPAITIVSATPKPDGVRVDVGGNCPECVENVAGMLQQAAQEIGAEVLPQVNPSQPNFTTGGWEGNPIWDEMREQGETRRRVVGVSPIVGTD